MSFSAMLSHLNTGTGSTVSPYQWIQLQSRGVGRKQDRYCEKLTQGLNKSCTHNKNKDIVLNTEALQRSSNAVWWTPIFIFISIIQYRKLLQDKIYTKEDDVCTKTMALKEEINLEYKIKCKTYIKKRTTCTILVLYILCDAGYSIGRNLSST